MTSVLPNGSAERKNIPLARGVLDYFPAALAAVAELSRAGNEKHNPGEDLHWARGKSTDHADCIMRHLIDRGSVDPEDKISHTVKIAWRALALLQEELEAQGAPMARGARVAGDPEGSLEQNTLRDVYERSLFPDEFLEPRCPLGAHPECDQRRSLLSQAADLGIQLEKRGGKYVVISR